MLHCSGFGELRHIGFDGFGKDIRPFPTTYLHDHLDYFRAANTESHK
jgi:hypothetical protein